MKKRWPLRALSLVLLLLVLNATVSLAADAGSSGDPLVTLSYLNDTYLNSILNRVDSKITSRNTTISQQIDQKIAQSGGTGSGTTASSSFVLVTLSKGQSLKLELGSEVLLRVGTASCVASSTPGLIDSTAGTTINNGAALTKNHLYMATIEGRSVKATAATVKIMVRGGYTVA